LSHLCFVLHSPPNVVDPWQVLAHIPLFIWCAIDAITTPTSKWITRAKFLRKTTLN
jgi:hypothetical protein